MEDDADPFPQISFFDPAEGRFTMIQHLPTNHAFTVDYLGRVSTIDMPQEQEPHANTALTVDYTGAVAIVDAEEQEIALRSFLTYSRDYHRCIRPTGSMVAATGPGTATTTTITTTNIDGTTPTTTTTTMNSNLSPRFEEVQDILRRMTQQYVYLYNTQIREEQQDELTAVWRRLLVDWMYFVVDYCKYTRESVAAAAHFLDVVISRNLVQTKQEYQLAAATSLQLALKAYDCQSIELKKLVQFGRHLFTEDDVVQMEITILRALNWRLHPPSTYCYLRQYERLLPSTVTSVARRMIADVTKLVAELTISEPKFNAFPPSITAYAGILLAMELIDFTNLPVPQRHCFVLNVASVAELQSKSPLVLKAFEELTRSFDSCPKLQDVMDSIAATKHRNPRVVVIRGHVRNPRFKPNHSVAKSSPRHIMTELDHHS